MFFPEPFPETIFGGPKRRSMLESIVLDPFWKFGGPKMNPFQQFGAKKIIKNNGGNLPGPTWGAGPPRNGDLRPKTVQINVFIDFS